MRKLLIFKHWQLFLLVTLLGFTGYPSPLKEVFNSIAAIIFFSWIYAIGVYGQEQIALLGLRPMNITFFKINVMVAGAILLTWISFSSVLTSDTASYMDFLIPAGLLYFIFASIQVMLFAAKTITKIEYQKEVSFEGYSTYFIFILFFFIGIWNLQPKINRLFTHPLIIM